MAYNFENVTPYVSTSAGTSAAQQNIINSVARAGQLYSAQIAQGLKDKKAINAATDKYNQDVDSGFATTVSDARTNGAVINLDETIQPVRDRIIEYQKELKNNSEANKPDLKFKITQLTGMIKSLVKDTEGQIVDTQEWNNSSTNERDVAMDPNLATYLNVRSQNKNYQPSVYDDDGNVITRGFDQRVTANLDTYTWDTSVTNPKGEEVYSVNSGSYSLMDGGLFSPTKGPINMYNKIAEENGIFASIDNGEGGKTIDYSQLNSKYYKNPEKGGRTVITTDSTPGKEIYQVQKQINFDLLRSDLYNSLTTSASSYLTNSGTAATAWNNNFVRTLDGKMSKEIQDNLAKIDFTGMTEDDVIIKSREIRDDVIKKNNGDPAEYDMWDSSASLNKEKTKLMKKRFSEEFEENYSTLLTDNEAIGAEYGPGKSSAQVEVNKNLSQFKANVDFIKVENLNGKGAGWFRNEEDKVYEFRQYINADPLNPTNYDYELVESVPSISFGDEQGFLAAIGK